MKLRRGGRAVVIVLGVVVVQAFASGALAQPPPDATRATRRLPADVAVRATRTLDPELLRDGKVKAIVDGAVEPVTAVEAATQAARGAMFVESIRAAAVAVTPPASLRAQAASTVLLGDEIVMPTANAERPLRSKLYLLDSAGLVYSGAARAFRGQVAVAFVNADKEDDQSPLPQAVSTLVRALGATVTPQPLEVTHFGRWYPVRIEVRSPVAPYTVNVTAHPGDPGASATLSVVPPSLTLTAMPRRIVGFGIGKARIDVSGAGLDTPQGTPVDLSVPTGDLSPSHVQLDASGYASASLRSAGTGQVTIAAASPFTGETTVTFSSPVFFLLAAVLGGLAGAFLRKRGRRRWGQALAVGAVTAVVMTLAYAVGIDWVARVPGAEGLAQNGEAMVFVLGAISALSGVSLMLPEK